MGYEQPDLYYQPEKFGLTQVGEVNWSDEAYQFDKTVVWKHEDGRFFLGEDSGCSCPSPFENFLGLSDAREMTKLRLYNYFADRVEANVAYEATLDEDEKSYIDKFPQDQIADLLGRIAQA
jgi:hypothetical protein